MAAIITQLSNTIIRAIEQDRRVRELDVIEERIAALEARTDERSREGGSMSLEDRIRRLEERVAAWTCPPSMRSARPSGA